MTLAPLRARPIQRVTLPKRPYTPMSPEESAFLFQKIAAGLTDAEAARMFFRRFGRDIAHRTVASRRRQSNPESKESAR